MLRQQFQNVVLPAVLCVAFSKASRAQAAPPVILEIDVENSVQYFEDTSDLTPTQENRSLGMLAVVSRNNYIEVRAEILQADGTPVGSLRHSVWGRALLRLGRLWIRCRAITRS
jgi:hypothetical protein